MNPYLRLFIWLCLIAICLAVWEYALPGAGMFFGAILAFAAICACIVYLVDHR